MVDDSNFSTHFFLTINLLYSNLSVRDALLTRKNPVYSRPCVQDYLYQTRIENTNTARRKFASTLAFLPRSATLSMRALKIHKYVIFSFPLLPALFLGTHIRAQKPPHWFRCLVLCPSRITQIRIQAPESSGTFTNRYES